MEDIAIKVLHPHEVTDTDITRLNALLTLLKSDSLGTSRSALVGVEADGGVIISARNTAGDIVGMALLLRQYTIEGVRIGHVESVVVDTAYRGQGVAQKMIERILGIALHSGVVRVRLTSKPAREVANHLYRKLGFELVLTNVYEKILPRE